jgi:hypothetical protein
MGISFSKKNNLNAPLLEFDIDNYQYEQNINDLIIENLKYKKKIEELEVNIQSLNNNYNDNLFELNQQIDLIKKDLETLITNDKILFQKINQSNNNNHIQNSFSSSIFINDD